MRSGKTLSGCARAALLSSCRLRSPAWPIWVTGVAQIELMDLLVTAQILLLKAAATGIHSLPPSFAAVSTPSLTVLFPCCVRHQGDASFNRRVSLRDSLNLKSYSRQRRPTRL